MASPLAWVVGFWSQCTLAEPKVGYLFCGMRIGPRQVLTVKHGLAGRKRIYARLMGDAVTRFKVTDWVEHPDLDAAILTLDMAPTSPDFAVWAPAAASPVQGTLTGVFEGRFHTAEINIGAPDPAHQHNLFQPEQPKGVSGGAVLVGGQVWGMAVRRYESEGIGCAIPVYLLHEWVQSQLQVVGVADAPQSARPASAPVSPRAASLARWLEQAQRQTLKQHLLDAAADLPWLAPIGQAGRSAPMDGLSALERISQHATPADPIAGHHLLGRALRKSREDLGDDAYRAHILPRVADLLAHAVGKVFDCDCVALPIDAGEPPSRVSRTPFDDIGISALLAAQLFCGQLHFVAGIDGWRPQWVFDLNAPPNGHLDVHAFYREAHRRLIGGESVGSLVGARESTELTISELAALKVRIRERIVQDENLVAFVDCTCRLQLTPSAVQRAEKFAADLDVNVLLQCDAATLPALRMSVPDFEAALSAFLNRHAANTTGR